MISERILEPEWLDALPASDPRAVKSRRDLAFVNRLMGHAGVIRRALGSHLTARTPRIADLGAGDGTLTLRIARAMRWPSAEIVLVDRQPVVTVQTLERFHALGCDATVEAGDVFEWLARTQPFDAIVTNLFLHHFDTPALEKVLAAIARRTTLFVACEPRRARGSLAGSRMLGLLGCNDVTRHDAVLSVRAGFVGLELSVLWPAPAAWRLEERAAGLFSHSFVASHPHPIPPPSRGRGVTPSPLMGQGGDGGGT